MEFIGTNCGRNGTHRLENACAAAVCSAKHMEGKAVCKKCEKAIGLHQIVPLNCGCLVCKPCVTCTINNALETAGQALFEAAIRNLYPRGLKVHFFDENGDQRQGEVIDAQWRMGCWGQCTLVVAVSPCDTIEVGTWQLVLPGIRDLEEVGVGGMGTSCCPKVRCPGGCKDKWIDSSEISEILPTALDLWEDKALQAFALANGYIKCPNQACGMLVERIHTGQHTLDSSAVQQNPGTRSQRANLHKERFRYRCGACGRDFCGVCLTYPYHNDYTCREAHAPNCRLCDEKVLDIPNLDGLRPRQLKKIANDRGFNSNKCLQKEELIDICQYALTFCQKDECKSKMKAMCKKKLRCGHRCCGIQNETSCLPCLEPDCLGPDSIHHQAVPIEECQICWEMLRSGPCIKLLCGHIFHLDCAKERVRQGFPGPPISFNFMNCPLCGIRNGELAGAQGSTAIVTMDHPSLQAELEPFIKLRQNVVKLAKQRLKRTMDGKGLEPIQPGGKFDGRPADYALQKYMYFQCHRCKKPYFGGERNCQNAANEENRDYVPEDLICGSCSAALSGDNCPKHGVDAIEWKCKYCCSVASWFCWGTTHMCDPCHAQCAASSAPKKQFCGSAAKCPLKVKHPPPGTEFCLGCAICRHMEVV